MHRYRSHTGGELRREHVGQTVRLAGWVHRVRDHGGLLFVDLRDHYGLTQVVADPDSPAFATAERLRAEWCIRVDGTVKARTPDTVNPNLPTGEVEVFASEIEVLSQAPELPLPVFGEPEYPEDTRLKYRFLDLRRERLHRNIMLRAAIIARMRELMREAGFTEFQTPILTASSPEGARDFLVPSRLHPGTFYALPQAPQQFKQLIMVAGFDRYFQVAPCFRDEDPRADRLPGEFYQLDLEMSFVTQDDVLSTMEPVISGVFEGFAEGRGVTAELPRIPFGLAMRQYGTDKPDLRNPLEMKDVSAHFRGSGFRVFAGLLERFSTGAEWNDRGEVWAIPAPSGGGRAFCDRMNGWAQREGQPGLGYIMYEKVVGPPPGSAKETMVEIFEERGQAEDVSNLRSQEHIIGKGPIANNIGYERTEAIRVQLGLKEGDAAFFVAGKPRDFVDFAGRARQKIGEELGLIDENRFALAWIVDFPMYEWNEEEKRVDFSHNPFSMPQGGLEALQSEEPLSLLAYQYDLVCNGYEIASGAIRNHKPEIMRRAFAIAGYAEQALEERFGGMLRALQFGAPPHGGMAAGIDRIVMLLAGERNLREVTMFPMNQQAQDLLMGAPSEVTPKQLRELHIRVIKPE